MLNIHQEPTGKGAAVLKLEGEVNIESVDQLRQALLAGLGELELLLINCDRVTSIDFFGIQMLCSAHRTSVVWKKQLTWQGDMGPAVKKSIQCTGFARQNGCDLCPDDGRCLWI